MSNGKLSFDSGKLNSAKQVIDEIYNWKVSCQNLDALKTIENFESQISQLSKAEIDTSALENQLKGLKDQLKSVLSAKAGAAKNGAHTAFDKKKSDLNIAVRNAQKIAERAETLNKKKGELVKYLNYIKGEVLYSFGEKIVEQITALNDEIKVHTRKYRS